MKKELKNLFKLAHRISVYVPTKDRENRALSENTVNELIDLVAGKMSEVNGGATSTEALGYWKSVTGELIKEKVVMVFSYTNNLEASIEAAVELANQVKTAANQDAVSVEVNNELYLV